MVPIELPGRDAIQRVCVVTVKQNARRIDVEFISGDTLLLDITVMKTSDTIEVSEFSYISLRYVNEIPPSSYLTVFKFKKEMLNDFRGLFLFYSSLQYNVTKGNLCALTLNCEPCTSIQNLNSSYKTPMLPTTMQKTPEQLNKIHLNTYDTIIWNERVLLPEHF